MGTSSTRKPEADGNLLTPVNRPQAVELAGQGVPCSGHGRLAFLRAIDLARKPRHSLKTLSTSSGKSGCEVNHLGRDGGPAPGAI
eukprot:7420107-Pyramimonas_sp.AAC.1